MLKGLCIGLLVVGWTLAGSARADQAGEGAPAAAKSAELSALKTDDLFKQGLSAYEKVEGEYRARARELATAELLLAEARQRLAEANVPAVDPALTDPRAIAEAAKGRKSAADQRLRLAQAQKELLDRVSVAGDGVQSAEVAYLNALDDLKATAVEIGLRVKDGTLAADKTPAMLSLANLARRRVELTANRDARRVRVASLVKEQDAAGAAMEESKRAVLAADADVAQSSSALAAEEKAQAIKKQYADRTPKDLAVELSALAEEGIGLKGTFELGLTRVDSAAAKADALRKSVEALKQPDVKIPQLSRPEDVEQAAAGTAQLVEFYDKRAAALEELSAALAAVVKLGTEFNADATVSAEHLFKMRVLAELIKKAGEADVTLIPEAEPDRVLAAVQGEAKSAAQVQAAVARAKADGPVVEKQLAETRAAAEAQQQQLARLKQSQASTLAGLAWEGQLKEMKAEQVVEAFVSGAAALKEKLAALEKERAGYDASLAKGSDLIRKLDGLKDPLLRAAEEAGQAEKASILGELRKEAGLDRAAPAAPAAPAPAAAPAAVEAKPAIVLAEKKVEPTDLEKAVAALNAFQQVVSGRVRVAEEREALGKELLAAIAALDKVDDGYGKALGEARELAARLRTTAIHLKKRIGKGEVSGDKIPADLSEALRPELSAKLDADQGALLTAQAQFKQRKEALEKPDPAAESGKALTRDLLTLVGKRLDVLADFNRSEAAYKAAREAGEAKRLEQEAAERQAGESAALDSILSIDSSKRSKSLGEVIESDYRELIDLEHREEALRQQRGRAAQLVELSLKEQEMLTKVRPVLEQQVAALEAAREEEAVLARARLKPEQADELIRAYKAKTGRLLNKPVPVGGNDKAQQVADLAAAIFEKGVHVSAAKTWDGLLAGRLGAAGIKAEAGTFQDEISRLNATSGANVRRIESLTGAKPAEPGTKAAAAITTMQTYPATGGSIGKTRAELTAVRTRGVVIIAIKLAVIILLALLLPKMLMPLLRRAMGGPDKADEHGNSELVVQALAVFVKTAVWITAIAFMLSVLGFDVTAIVAGLGIGGLAIGLAAQPMISDVISAVIIFAERKFTIGDVIKIGGDAPAKVVGLSWRGTQLKGSDGLVVNVPNRNLTSATIQNLTKEGRTYDSLAIDVTTTKDVKTVLGVIRKAAAESKHLAGESGYSIKAYSQKGDTRVIKYQLWWFLRDFDVRDKTRDEVFTSISAGLAHEDMAGTEVSLA